MDVDLQRREGLRPRKRKLADELTNLSTQDRADLNSRLRRQDSLQAYRPPQGRYQERQRQSAEDSCGLRQGADFLAGPEIRSQLPSLADSLKHALQSEKPDHLLKNGLQLRRAFGSGYKSLSQVLDDEFPDVPSSNLYPQLSASHLNFVSGKRFSEAGITPDAPLDLFRLWSGEDSGSQHSHEPATLSALPSASVDDILPQTTFGAILDPQALHEAHSLLPTPEDVLPSSFHTVQHPQSVVSLQQNSHIHLVPSHESGMDPFLPDAQSVFAPQPVQPPQMVFSAQPYGNYPGQPNVPVTVQPVTVQPVSVQASATWDRQWEEGTHIPYQFTAAPPTGIYPVPQQLY